MYRALQRLLLPVRSLIGFLPAPFLQSVRSRRASIRILCSSLILLLLNGHLRHQLELEETLDNSWNGLIDWWRGLLWFLDRAPILIDILTLGVETVDGMFAPRDDTYRMLAHDARSQKYLSLAWKFPYTPKRVADNFQMPSCDLVS